MPDCFRRKGCQGNSGFSYKNGYTVLINEINGLVQVVEGDIDPQNDPLPNSRLDFVKKIPTTRLVKVSSAHASSLRNKPRKSR